MFSIFGGVFVDNEDPVKSTDDLRSLLFLRGYLHETGKNSSRCEFVIFAVVYMKLGRNASLIT